MPYTVLRKKEEIPASELPLQRAAGQGIEIINEARSDGLGRGFEVAVRLPLAYSPQEVRHQSEYGGDGLDARVVRKALIIEDDRDFSRGLGRVLNQIGGHEVEIAPDGRTGIAVAAQFLPDVVLCDLRLGGEIDGYEVARIIKGLPASQSPSLVIALTGFTGEREKKQAEDQGFDLYIT
jgi:CheY-like chemotaxis protein